MKGRIYIAGKLRDNSLDYLAHVRNMCLEAEKVRQAGFSVYVPAWDLLQALIVGDLTFSPLFNNSIGWLEVSDAIFVIKEGAQSSKGTQREIARAQKLGIPVFYSLSKMIKHFKENEK